MSRDELLTYTLQYCCVCYVALNLWSDVMWLYYLDFGCVTFQQVTDNAERHTALNVCCSYLKDVWWHFSYSQIKSHDMTTTNNLTQQLHWVTFSIITMNMVSEGHSLWKYGLFFCGNVLKIWTSLSYFVLMTVYIIKLAIGPHIKYCSCQ